ncbi:MAG TPA: TlpA disulfide reductase family protein [Bauldia sp.]|nr:TlpA disulfide reductase family protein [Bauldia sp.]
MPESTSRPRRPRTVLIGAALAGVLAGAVAVYVMASRNGNGDVAAAECEAAIAAAERAAPHARGEVAAFRVATEPQSLADLAFTGPDGKPVTLAALAGKVSLINIWATWCVPCREEMPTLDRLEMELGGEDFAVIPINIDLNATERAKAFLEEIGVASLPFYSDPSGRLFQDLKRRGLAIGLPTTILVDGKGCRIGVLEGPAKWDSDDAKALIRAAAGV